MHPLDVTHKALMTRSWIEYLRALGNRAGAAAAAMLDFYECIDKEKYGGEAGPLHDPCVIAYLLRPALFAGKACRAAHAPRPARNTALTVSTSERVVEGKNGIVL